VLWDENHFETLAGLQVKNFRSRSGGSETNVNLRGDAFFSSFFEIEMVVNVHGKSKKLFQFVTPQI
jgi:hypothetical protein